MTDWKAKQYSGQTLQLGSLRMGYDYNATRSKGDPATADDNWVGAMSFEVRVKPTKGENDMKARLLRVARQQLTSALAALDEFEAQQTTTSVQHDSD